MTCGCESNKRNGMDENANRSQEKTACNAFAPCSKSKKCELIRGSTSPTVSVQSAKLFVSRRSIKIVSSQTLCFICRPWKDFSREYMNTWMCLIRKMIFSIFLEIRIHFLWLNFPVKLILKSLMSYCIVQLGYK